jgi:hypothetical protein
MMFRKKPVVIEAIQLVPETVRECLNFVGNAGMVVTQTFDAGINIATLEGVHHASYGDWIIKGVKGEFYPCKPDIFEQTYELVETE